MIILWILHDSHSNPSTLLSTSLFRFPVFTGMSLPLRGTPPCGKPKQGCFAFRLFSIRNLHFATTGIEHRDTTFCVFNRLFEQRVRKKWSKNTTFLRIFTKKTRIYAHFVLILGQFSHVFPEVLRFWLTQKAINSLKTDNGLLNIWKKMPSKRLIFKKSAP